ncbi:MULTISPECIES: hypothetical protein [Bacillus cereus group]|nr:hypothetical protein [Bacillus thuringiensis]MCP1398621.1 hypothetical protein [Bacillus cereus]MEC2259211.1 hypothetical protein [Bacillus cereus]OBW88374.1 hypothetical protein A9L49_13035 [Bacillus cereus]PER51541.1 hypothetical protein CN486_26815 [Bacillus thuringiensis]PES48713.1 hypothetical protein CN499_16720 [Bacillus thuringiensis]
MKSLMEKLYEELYSPKITPYELVSNAKLSNYNYVNMTKSEDGGLYVESSCILDDGESAIFMYYFDVNDHLITLKSVIGNLEETIYHRPDEILKVKVQLQNIIQTQSAVI